jgi:hypothetical protein
MISFFVCQYNGERERNVHDDDYGAASFACLGYKEKV